MLRFTFKPFLLIVIMLSVVMLSVIMLNVIMPSVIWLNVIMTGVIMLNVIRLNVVTSKYNGEAYFARVISYVCSMFKKSTPGHKFSCHGQTLTDRTKPGVNPIKLFYRYNLRIYIIS
jgi:hypothetical protein